MKRQRERSLLFWQNDSQKSKVEIEWKRDWRKIKRRPRRRHLGNELAVKRQSRRRESRPRTRQMSEDRKKTVFLRKRRFAFPNFNTCLNNFSAPSDRILEWKRNSTWHTKPNLISMPLLSLINAKTNNNVTSQTSTDSFSWEKSINDGSIDRSINRLTYWLIDLPAD